MKINAALHFRIGQNVKLLCQVEGREWEYCYWSHERNGGCEWEWKQAYGDVRMQVCSGLGDFDIKEWNKCGLELDSASVPPGQKSSLQKNITWAFSSKTLV